MSGSSLWSLVILAAACLLSCYFSALQIALKTFSRAKLADMLEASGREHRLALFLEHADPLLLVTGTIRTCLNMLVLLSVLYLIEIGFVGSPVGQSEETPRTILTEYALAFVIAGVLVTVFSVALPISIARYFSERLLARSLRPMLFLLTFLRPLANALHVFDPIVRRMSGADEAPQPENPLTDEILSVVEEHETGGNVDPAQKQMIEAVFELPTTTVGEIMTPRTEIQALPATASLDEVKSAIIRFGHSRIPVYDQTIDNVVGILYAKDLLDFLGSERPFELRSVLREALMVPETKSVRELLAEFKTRKVHMAIVLDEYGGTAGLLTIEDIIEELVGEIQDEYESSPDEPDIQKLDDRTAEADARVNIHDLNSELNLSLPEDEDYATVGGFVFSTLGHIPTVGEEFRFANARFTVMDAAKTKVKRVKVEKLAAEELAPEPDETPAR